MIVLKSKHIEGVIIVASKQIFENTDIFVRGVVIESDVDEYKIGSTQTLIKENYKDITSEYNISNQTIKEGAITIPKGYKGRIDGDKIIIEPEVIYLKYKITSDNTNNPEDVFVYIKKDIKQEVVITEVVFKDGSKKKNNSFKVDVMENDNLSYSDIKEKAKVIDKETFDKKLNEYKSRINNL